MMFHENCLLADDSHEISSLISTEIRKNITEFVVSAVVIGALRVKMGAICIKMVGLFPL